MLISFTVLATAVYDGEIYTSVITVNAVNSQQAIFCAAGQSRFNIHWHNANTGDKANNINVEYFSIVSYEIRQL